MDPSNHKHLVMRGVPIFVAVFTAGLSFILDPLTLHIGIGDDFQPTRLFIGVFLLVVVFVALLALSFQKRWTLLSILILPIIFIII